MSCSAIDMFHHQSKRGRPAEWLDPNDWHSTEELAKNFDTPFFQVLENAAKEYPSIAMTPDVLGGTPRVVGTRIPVFMILDAIEYHGALAGALKSYPNLTMENVKDAVSFAAAVLEHPIDYEAEDTSR